MNEVSMNLQSKDKSDLCHRQNNMKMSIMTKGSEGFGLMMSTAHMKSKGRRPSCGSERGHP